VATSSHKYEWLYLHAFVRPATGDVEWWIANTVNVALFQAILNAFAKQRSIAGDNPAVLLLDNAGWHHGKNLKFPDGRHPDYLPAYTPELQPAERLWTLTDEPIVNKAFDSLDELDRILGERCRALSGQPERIKDNTKFSWWPAK
jgi:transposase